MLPALQTMNYVSLFAAIISQHSFSKDIKIHPVRTLGKKKKRKIITRSIIYWTDPISVSAPVGDQKLRYLKQ